MDQVLDIKGYCKLRDLTYKQVRLLREKSIGRWHKDGKLWKITVKDEDVVPGVENEQRRAPVSPANQGELDLFSGDSEEAWKLRKLKAETLLKEQQNDAFLFQLLTSTMDVFTETMEQCLAPVRQAIQALDLSPAQAETVNRAWDRFTTEAEEISDREVQKLLTQMMGGE